MKTNAYWILPTGEITKPSIYHIGFVIKNPKKFGMTDSEIKKIYQKYDEPMSPTAEGKAREYIMERLLRKKFIRIRENRTGSYTIQLNKLTPENGDYLWIWANKISQTAYDKYADITIHQLQGNKMTRTSLDKLASGMSVLESIKNHRLLTSEECEYIRVYTDDDVHELPDYFDYAESMIDENTEQWVFDEIIKYKYKAMNKHLVKLYGIKDYYTK